MAGRHVHLEDVFRQRHDARHARGAAAEENPGAQIVGETGRLQILRDELENLLQPQRHDALKMPDVDALEFEAELVGEAQGLLLRRLGGQRGAMLQFQFMGARQRHFQPDREVAGNMVAADRQHAGMPDDAVGVGDVFRGAAADVNHQRAQLLLLVGQQRERHGNAVEHDVFHFQRRGADEADGILQAVGIAVDDVHVHLQPRAQHPDGVRHAVLAVHIKMLPHMVDDRVLGGKIDGLGVLDHVLDVVRRNFAVGGNDRVHAAVVEAADVPAADAEIDAADLHVGHLLGLENRMAQIFLDLFGVDDLALAHAVGARLAEADDVQRALGVLLADHDANLGCADFEAGNDVGIVKHFSSGF